MMDKRMHVTARELAEQSMVLLRNEGGILPLRKNGSVDHSTVQSSLVTAGTVPEERGADAGVHLAIFGRGQVRPVYSGSGSGASGGASVLSVAWACRKEGIIPVPELVQYYEAQAAAEPALADGEIDWSQGKQLVNSGIMYELFGRYHAPVPEYDIPEDLMQTASRKTDTALLILSRNSGGEECDRHLEGDYKLTDSEQKLLNNVCAHFRRVVVVVNANGLIDLSWQREFPEVKSILFAGVFGEGGTEALARILSGRVNPSGHLAFTIAEHYTDWPAASYFTFDKDGECRTYSGYGLSAEENGSRGFNLSPVALYHEGIFNGYRYFDTFGVKPLYPFGYGLSYTTFRWEMISCHQVVDTPEYESINREAGGNMAHNVLCSGSVDGENTAENVETQSFKRDINKDAKFDLVIRCRVHNTGSRTGRAVLQMYTALKESGVSHPEKELRDFAKTEPITAGDSAEVSLRLRFRDLVMYDEARAAWVIHRGSYHIRIGFSSAETEEVAVVRADEDIIVEQVTNRLGLRECNQKLRFLESPAEVDEAAPTEPQTESETGMRMCIPDTPAEHGQRSGQSDRLKEFHIVSTDIDLSRICVNDQAEKSNSYTCGDSDGVEDAVTAAEAKADAPAHRDVEMENNRRIRTTCERLTDRQLAAMCVGFGPGVAFSAFKDTPDPDTICDEAGEPLTVNDNPAGRKGYVSPAIPSCGMHSFTYQDGPAGIGLTAWPSEMLLACSFDREVLYRFGEAIGVECRQAQVDVLLAPAVNLHRNPLCGRNFEYFSEDPYLTGTLAVAMAQGVQEQGVLVCPKHFALNEQETWRRGNSRRNINACDSIIEERAARELYLKPFEMLTREGDVHVIMTSFNRINGTFAAGNKDLNTEILRNEWGFRGIVVTDWGDMDTVVNGADAVTSGNDIVMPGGPPVIQQILDGLAEGRVTRFDLMRSAERLMRVGEMIRERKMDEQQRVLAQVE